MEEHAKQQTMKIKMKMASKGYVGYLLSAASNPTVQAALETTTAQRLSAETQTQNQKTLGSAY